MGDEPSQPGGTGGFSTVNVTPGAFQQQQQQQEPTSPNQPVYSPVQMTAENQSNFQPVHQYGGSQHSFSPQLEQQGAGRGTPYNMNAMLNSLPQSNYNRHGMYI
jgi:hypothetical protein